MPKTTVLCYMNWAIGYAVPDPSLTSKFATTAPMSNLLTERPGQKAVWDDVSTPELRFFFVDPSNPSLPVGRPMDVVALVNCNLISLAGESTSILLTMTDSLGNNATFLPGNVSIGLTSSTQNNIVYSISEDNAETWDVGFDSSDVTELYFSCQSSEPVFGVLDAWTNTVSLQDPFFGTLVAGPEYRPQYGLKLVGYSPGTIDRSIIARSIGGSLWAAQSKRQRRLAADFVLVSETEVEAVPPSCGLRQLGEYCGISRPVLIVPSDESAARTHTQAVYGCFDEPLSWTAVDKVDDIVNGVLLKEPHYTCSFTVLESR